MNYLRTTFKDFKTKLEATTELLTYLFSTDQYGNIIFHYYDIDGNTVTYDVAYEDHKSRLKYDGLPDQYNGPNKADYTVKRLAKPFQNKDGKTVKYLNPKDAGNQIYVSALYALFLHPTPEWDTFSLNGRSKIIVVEGQKKALALCLAGIPAVGTTGLTGALIPAAEFEEGTYKPTLKRDLVAIIERFGFTEFELMQDQDNTDNADRLQRAKKFKSALTKNIQAAQEIGLKTSFSYPITPNHKGIDDLLTAKDISKDEVIKELNRKTSKRPKFVQRHLINSNTDLKQVEELILRSSNDYRPLLPDAQNIDHWINESGYLDQAPIGELIQSMLYYDECLFNVLQVPTGAGKSTATILAMQQQLQQLPEATFLVLVPYHLLNKKFIEEFMEKHSISLNNYNDTKELKNGIINIAVYNQLAEMNPFELEQIDLCVVDEIDRLYNEITYRSKLANVEFRLQEINTIGLSATPAYSVIYADNLLKVSSNQKPQISLLKIEDRQHAVINQCLLLLNAGLTGLVRINNAKECILIREKLRELRPDKNISFVCSIKNNDYADKQDFSTRKAVLRGRLDCDIIISTSCLDCGVSIIDGIDTVIAVNEYSINTLIQIQKRSRIVESKVILLHSHKRNENATPPNLEGMEYILTKKAKALTDYYNADISPTDSGKISAIGFTDNTLIAFDSMAHQYFSNRCEIAMRLDRAMNSFYSNNFDAFNTDLAKHFDIIEIGTDDATGETLKYQEDDTELKAAIEERTLQPEKAETPKAIFWLSIKKSLNNLLGPDHADNDLLKYKSKASATNKVRSLKNYFRSMEALENKRKNKNIEEENKLLIEAIEEENKPIMQAIAKEDKLQNEILAVLDLVESNSYQTTLYNLVDLQKHLDTNRLDIDANKLLNFDVNHLFTPVQVLDVFDQVTNYCTNKANIKLYGSMEELNELLCSSIVETGKGNISKVQLLTILKDCFLKVDKDIELLAKLKEELELSIPFTKDEIKKNIARYFDSRKPKLKKPGLKKKHMAKSSAIEHDLYIQSEIIKALDLTESHESREALPAADIFLKVQNYFKNKRTTALEKVKESRNWSKAKIKRDDYQQYYDYLDRPHSFSMTETQFKRFLNLLFITKKTKKAIEGDRRTRWSIHGLNTADYDAYKIRQAAAAQREEEELQTDIIEATEKAELYAQIKPKIAAEIRTVNSLNKSIITCPKPRYIYIREGRDTLRQSKTIIHLAKNSKAQQPLRLMPIRPKSEQLTIQAATA